MLRENALLFVQRSGHRLKYYDWCSFKTHIFLFLDDDSVLNIF